MSGLHPERAGSNPAGITIIIFEIENSNKIMKIEYIKDSFNLMLNVCGLILCMAIFFFILELSMPYISKCLYIISEFMLKK